MENLHNKNQFYNKLNKVNARKWAKAVSIFDISTLYTIIPYNFLIEFLWEIIKFAFKFPKTYTRVGSSSAFVYLTSENSGKRYFTEATLILAASWMLLYNW